MIRLSKFIGKIILRISLLMMAAWASAAIFYSNLPAALRPWVAGIFAISSLVALVGKYSERRTRLGFLAAFALVLIFWLLMPPSNDRNWQPDVAKLPWAEINGERVTIHNIRNFDYRSETDYTSRYYDKTFDLTRLSSVYLSVVHWGSPSIAHTMLSFGFGGDDVICFSIETRKEVGEVYSTVKGFFRQYELTYIVADERDLIGLRTNYRGEEVYLYQLNIPMDFARKVFLDYLREVNSLKDRPEWYNALTSNCTTNMRNHTVPYNPNARFDWRIIANGYLDEMLYERGAINTSLPFQELKALSFINTRAKGLDKSPDFSRMIRIGFPAGAKSR